MKKEVTLTGIIGIKGGYGFKTIFNSKEDANKYKDMIRFILEDDKFKVIYKTSYHDSEEYKK